MLINLLINIIFFIKLMKYNNFIIPQICLIYLNYHIVSQEFYHLLKAFLD